MDNDNLEANSSKFTMTEASAIEIKMLKINYLKQFTENLLKIMLPLFANYDLYPFKRKPQVKSFDSSKLD